MQLLWKPKLWNKLPFFLDTDKKPFDYWGLGTFFWRNLSDNEKYWYSSQYFDYFDVTYIAVETRLKLILN